MIDDGVEDLRNGADDMIVDDDMNGGDAENGGASSTNNTASSSTAAATKGKYHIEDDDNQDGGEYPSLKDEEISNEARLDELLQNTPMNEQHNVMFTYLQKGIYYPFTAQWRNPLISAIKENVIVKSVVQFNPYFGCVMVVEPLYEFEDVGGAGGSSSGSHLGSSGIGAGAEDSDDDDHSSKRRKKTKKVSVSDLTSTGYYVMAVDLFGLKKKSVIGRILDDHRKFVKRCVLVNYIKCFNEVNYLEICRHECETRIPNLSTITEAFPNSIRLKSSEDEVLKKIVDIYQSHGGRPPQKLNKKIDVNTILPIEDMNKRLTAMCPEGTGCLNDLPTLVKYVTTCLTFPFEAKVTTRYSFLYEQEVEFTINVTSVNYRCKQGIIFKGTITSGQIEPLDYKFMVKDSAVADSDDESDDEGRSKKRRRLPGNVAVTPLNTYNGREVKVNAGKLRLSGTISETNRKVLTDYQVWFCHSTLLDEKKLDDQWNNLRYFLQFIQ